MRIDPIHHHVADTTVVHPGKPGHPPSDRTHPRPHYPRNHSPPLDLTPALLQINQHWLIERHGYRTPTEAREHLRAQAAAAA